jgi:hypothetical protein
MYRHALMTKMKRLGHMNSLRTESLLHLSERLIHVYGKDSNVVNMFSPWPIPEKEPQMGFIFSKNSGALSF